MAEYEMERVEDDSPLRCQANDKFGQCQMKAVYEGGNCPMHGGNKQADAKEAASIRNYNVAKWQVELNKHADSPRLKFLNEEVAILRMALEAQLNQCDDLNDMVLKSHLISELVTKIDKLVNSCHKLESSLGGLMDKQAILTFASSVIEVIGSVVTDEQQLEQISDGVLQLVGELGKAPEDA